MSELDADFERAWKWREERGLFRESLALRVFHGPGESASAALRELAIDRFGDHYWVTAWEKDRESEQGVPTRVRAALEKFLRSKGAVSAVSLSRPEKTLPAEPQALFGTPPEDRFETSEGRARFWIRLRGSRHPGLFLDHAPLRRWLEARARGWTALNTFSYTGSLSISCALGGAAHVTTLDLAKPAIRWAEENWELNALAADRARFIAGDVFEWLPRLKREGKRFDCVILDPPSFSHGKKGSFSTAKDSVKLHELAMDLLAPGGTLVTSINSANIDARRFEADVVAAARARKRDFDTLMRIDLPETFPTPLGAPEARYLKGLVLRARG